MNLEELVKKLRDVSFAKFLSDEDLVFLLNKGRQVVLRPNEVLFTEGSFKETFFIVLKGKVEIYRRSKSIALRTAGDYLGEMAILESKPRSASVRAVTGALLLELDKDIFMDYLASKPKVVWEIMKTFSERARADLDAIDSTYLGLRKSEDEYRNILESMSDLIFKVNPKGIVLYANPAVALLGYHRFELIGEPFANIIDLEKTAVDFREIFTGRVGSRSTNNLEVEFLVNQKSTLYDLTRSAPYLLNATGMWDVPNEFVLLKDYNKKLLGSILNARPEKLSLMM